uniref:phosphoglucomutase (alpha-D-glucose-1,6-bisphosphate-dependent) n=1 Tax=Prasinoderma coloniale TaxID=156133 RepID=A0A7R9TXW9_9VIRI|eukprot:PRCOL_00000723-RA
MAPERPARHAELYSLQNGSDVRGVALEGVEGEDVRLNPARAAAIGAAFARWLQKRAPTANDAETRVALGRDSRLSGESLASAAAAGARSAGAMPTDVGLATTPAMFMSTITEGYEFDGGVMLTASHLPFNRNGMKFFTSRGGLGSADIAEVLDIAAQLVDDDELPQESEHSLAPHEDFLPAYAASLRKRIIDGVGAGERPLEGMAIVVDAGNGAGGFFAGSVLEPLGADVSASQFLEPDGTFPNHIPNPEDAEAMESCAAAVLRAGADLGVVFDTDVDRSGLVLPDGQQVNRNRLIAALSAAVLRDSPGATIVTDSVTSAGLADFIKARGGVHCRYKRGYKNVINKGVELNEAGVDCPLMIETSGHGAMRENYYLDDGAYLAVCLIIEAARAKRAGGEGLASLLDGLKEPAEAKEARLKIMLDDFGPYGDDIIARFIEFCNGSAAPSSWTSEEVNNEGWRVRVDEGDGKQGWALLRKSLHDPLLVCNVESDTEGGLEPILEALRGFLSQFDKLDISKL